MSRPRSTDVAPFVGLCAGGFAVFVGLLGGGWPDLLRFGLLVGGLVGALASLPGVLFGSGPVGGGPPSAAELAAMGAAADAGPARASWTASDHARALCPVPDAAGPPLTALLAGLTAAEPEPAVPGVYVPEGPAAGWTVEDMLRVFASRLDGEAER